MAPAFEQVGLISASYARPRIRSTNTLTIQPVLESKLALPSAYAIKPTKEYLRTCLRARFSRETPLFLPTLGQQTPPLQHVHIS